MAYIVLGHFETTHSPTHCPSVSVCLSNYLTWDTWGNPGLLWQQRQIEPFFTVTLHDVTTHAYPSKKYSKSPVWLALWNTLWMLIKHAVRKDLQIVGLFPLPALTCPNFEQVGHGHRHPVKKKKIPHRPRSVARELIPCRPLSRRGWNPIKLAYKLAGWLA